MDHTLIGEFGFILYFVWYAYTRFSISRTVLDSMDSKWMHSAHRRMDMQGSAACACVRLSSGRKWSILCSFRSFCVFWIWQQRQTAEKNFHVQWIVVRFHWRITSDTNNDNNENTTKIFCLIVLRLSIFMSRKQFLCSLRMCATCTTTPANEDDQNEPKKMNRMGHDATTNAHTHSSRNRTNAHEQWIGVSGVRSSVRAICVVQMHLLRVARFTFNACNWLLFLFSVVLASSLCFVSISRKPIQTEKCIFQHARRTVAWDSRHFSICRCRTINLLHSCCNRSVSVPHTHGHDALCVRCVVTRGCMAQKVHHNRSESDSWVRWKRRKEKRRCREDTVPRENRWWWRWWRRGRRCKWIQKYTQVQHSEHTQPQLQHMHTDEHTRIAHSNTSTRTSSNQQTADEKTARNSDFYFMLSFRLKWMSKMQVVSVCVRVCVWERVCGTLFVVSVWESLCHIWNAEHKCLRSNIMIISYVHRTTPQPFTDTSSASSTGAGAFRRFPRFYSARENTEKRIFWNYVYLCLQYCFVFYFNDSEPNRMERETHSVEWNSEKKNRTNPNGK